MGSNASKNIQQMRQENVLDVSRSLSPELYIKHLQGECLEGALLDLPAETFNDKEISLFEELNASFHFIGSVPEQFSFRFPHLRHIDLSHNQLTSLPDTFSVLLHLRTLFLSNNRFRNFPSNALMTLPHLHTLDLSHNFLRDLPTHGWENLKELSKLNVSDNQLQLLPNSMCQSTSLTVIVVKNNQLMHPPKQVVTQGSAAIINFLRSKFDSAAAVLGNYKKPEKILGSPVFRRVRGSHVSATVTNPESAWKQYQQGSYSGPGHKRKCPLMPPKDATSLSPQELTQALMGLVYGAAVAECVGLNCEGLDRSETQFYYDPMTLGPDTRVRDFLRSHYPLRDWGPFADLMLLTLDSVLRWGGVVDELEWAAQAHQWTIHGISDIDDRPGHSLSPILKQVLSSEQYAVNPYSCADAALRSVSQSLGNRQVSDEDSFVVQSSIGGNDCVAPLNPNDNSCLTPALVLGLPSFSEPDEVRSNAERICRASHAAQLPRCAAKTVASLVAAVLQGRLQSVKTNPEIAKDILNEIFEECLGKISEDSEKLIFMKVWQGDMTLTDANWPPSHVINSLVHIRMAVIKCSRIVADQYQLKMVRSSPTASLPSCNTAMETVSRMVSSPSLDSPTSIMTHDKHRSKSLDHSSSSGQADPITCSVADANSISLDLTVKTQPITCSQTQEPLEAVFRRLVAEVSMQGGWGACAHACVVGGVLGAFIGYDNLPISWLHKLPKSNKRYLNDQVNHLLDLFGLP